MDSMRFTVALFCVLELGFSATPIMKSGSCPTLTRYNAPSSDDWSQFPIKPTPSSQFPTGTLQNPLPADSSINCIQVPTGMHLELWADETMPGNIAYVQSFTFDERGRMWVVEPRDYPNTIVAASGNNHDAKFTGGLGRILILEDTNGDHVMDKATVFKDSLNLPQGIEVVNGGVVVAMGPYLVFFPNVNDHAGTPKILWQGMGPTGNYDTHGGINSLMYGLDNWVYGHTGYNTCTTSNGDAGNGVNCGNGSVWRFQHTAIGDATTNFQVWSTGPSNAHGIGQMEDGEIFQSGATGSSHSSFSIGNGLASISDITSNGSPANAYYPITGDRYLWDFSTAGGSGTASVSTATSGHNFYTSRVFPQRYWSRMSFVCEGASKLCNQDSMAVNTNGSNTGSGWNAIRLPGPSTSNIFASTDAWVAPILVKTGPDGALWVLDWYNYLFLHNPASPSGPGGAWVNALRTKTRCRIYRIVPDNATLDPVLDLTNATDAQLVATLSNQNFLWRMQAQRLLVGRGASIDTATLTLLQNILQTSRAVDAIGNDPAVTHAVWVLNGLGQFTANPTRWNPILDTLLHHPAWGTRRNVLMAMPRTAATAQAISDACMVNDVHGHVRLQALFALAASPKITSPTPIWSTYANVDAAATSAVQSAGLATSASMPCTPTYATAVQQPATMSSQPRNDVHFDVTADGFALKPYGQLPSGELVVYNIRGEVVFRSEYDESRFQWSQASAKGLHNPLYFYVYRPFSGIGIQSGSIPIGVSY